MEQVLVKRKSVRTAPINLKECDKELFYHEFEKFYFDPFYLLNNNCCLTENLAVIKNFKIVSNEKFFSKAFFIKSRKKRLRVLIQALVKNKRTFSEKGILAVDNWSKGYFHWLTDVLPKLITLPDQFKNYCVYLPEQYRGIQFVEGSLLMLGIMNVCYLKRGETLKIKQLVVPGIMAETGNYHDEVIRALRAKIFKHFTVNEEPSLKLFVIRNKSLSRSIVNQNEVIDVAKKNGFKVICFEAIAWAEQVSLAIKCKFLIGLHGAGLTNMLFMREGNTVLELRAKNDSLNNCYFTLASALQLHYAYQLCEVKNLEKSTQENDFFVDKDVLETNIKTLLKKVEIF